jgi:hypothetical protein
MQIIKKREKLLIIFKVGLGDQHVRKPSSQVEPACSHERRAESDVPGDLQGCKMAYFQTKIPILVNFGGSCNGKCWYILWPFGLFYGHLVYFTYGRLVYLMVIWYILPMAIWYILYMVIWCIFPTFGMLYQEKSGSPGN